MLNSRYLLSTAQRGQSKNSNLSHHQQRGIVTNLPPAFYGICPKLYSSDFVFKIKFNIFLRTGQVARPDGHFPWISEPEWKIQNWLCGGQTCIELCRETKHRLRIQTKSDIKENTTNQVGLMFSQSTQSRVGGFFQFCRNISTNPLCQHSSSCLSYRLLAFWQICLVRPNCSRELNTLESVQAAHKTVSDATLPELYWAHNLLSNLHHLNWN